MYQKYPPVFTKGQNNIPAHGLPIFIYISKWKKSLHPDARKNASILRLIKSLSECVQTPQSTRQTFHLFAIHRKKWFASSSPLNCGWPPGWPLTTRLLRRGWRCDTLWLMTVYKGLDKQSTSLVCPESDGVSLSENQPHGEWRNTWHSYLGWTHLDTSYIVCTAYLGAPYTLRFDFPLINKLNSEWIMTRLIV